MNPFHRLSQDQLNHMVPGQRSIQDTLASPTGDTEEISAAGALSITTPITQLSVSGTKAYTLAAPTHAGMRKRVICVAAASSPAGTLTVSSPDDTSGLVCPSTFFFDTAGQELEFEATYALKWRCVKKVRAGQKTLVVGTTVTTGIADMSHINLSVTASVASTAADKSIPNGAAVGEILVVGCSTAASTPHGDIGGAFVARTGTAGTSLDDFTATTDSALLQWNGSAWQVLALQGATLAVV